MKALNKIIIVSSGIMLVSLIASFFNYDSIIQTKAAAVNNVTGGNISLVDQSDAQIKTYYSGVESLSGASLKSALNSKIATSYTVSDSMTWSWMQITDRDWSISSSVNPSTYTFAGDTSWYYHNLYASYNGDVNRALTRADNTDSTSGDTDREHCWPKSYGFKFTSSGDGNSFVPPAGTDLHHLMASDHNNNNIHNNYGYGNVDFTKTYSGVTDVDGQNASQVTGYFGYSKLEANATKKVYEPADEYKGDVARACLYMATRYISATNTTPENPRLTLTDDLSLLVEEVSTNPTGIGYYGELSTFLSWNELDPVDSYEIHRNNLIYNNVSGNRNPYVDHPEWARIVYDSTYTGSGANNDLNASTSGTGSVAKTIVGISINTLPTKTTFSLKEPFERNELKINVNYSDSTSEIISTGFQVSGYSSSMLGEQNISVTYEGFSASYSITVTNNGADVGESENNSGTYTSDVATGGAITSWSGSTGSAYADGGVKLDATGRYIQNLSCISSVNTTISTLTISVVAKINGTAVSTNKTTVYLLNSDGEVVSSISDLGSITTTKKAYTYIFSDISGGVEASGLKYEYTTKVSGNVEVYSISATYGSTLNHNATPTEQAESFAEYVMRYGNNAEGNCTLIFATLKSEYNYMTSESKTLFNSLSSTTNAKARYDYLSLYVDNNVLKDNLHVNAQNDYLSLLGLFIVGIASIGVYFTLIKKKSKVM